MFAFIYLLTYLFVYLINSFVRLYGSSYLGVAITPLISTWAGPTGPEFCPPSCRWIAWATGVFARPWQAKGVMTLGEKLPPDT